MAQGLGKGLGRGEVLLGRLPEKEGGPSAPHAVWPRPARSPRGYLSTEDGRAGVQADLMKPARLPKVCRSSTVAMASVISVPRAVARTSPHRHVSGRSRPRGACGRGGGAGLSHAAQTGALIWRRVALDRAKRNLALAGWVASCSAVASGDRADYDTCAPGVAKRALFMPSAPAHRPQAGGPLCPSRRESPFRHAGAQLRPSGGGRRRDTGCGRVRHRQR